MVLETHGEEFHVALWRMGDEKLGLKVAVAENTLRINAITGSRIEEMNRRCRTCHVKQILEQQLLEKDQVVSVNRKIVLQQMLAELSNVKVYRVLSHESSTTSSRGTLSKSTSCSCCCYKTGAELVVARTSASTDD